MPGIVPASNDLTTVVIQDSELMQMSRMENVFSAQDGYFLAYCPFDLPEFVAYCSKFEPCVAIVHLDFLERGRASLPELLRAYRSVRLLVRTGECKERDVEELVLLGCWGLIVKTTGLDVLKKAADAIAANEIWASRRVLTRVLRRITISEERKISPREMEVLRLLAQEGTNKSIAVALYISPETLRWHLRNLYTKTGIRNRQALVTYAKELLGEAVAPGTRARQRAAGENVKVLGE